MKTRARATRTLLLALAVTGVTLAWSQRTGESVRIQSPVDHDLYVAAREVEIRADVDGDVVAAGQQVHVAATVSGDVIAAGETVEIRGKVLDDVRAAGRQIRIGAPVAGHLTAAGGSVVIEPGQQVGDWAWLAGESVEVAGDVGGELKVAAQEVTVSGEIGGDVELLGERFRLGPGAVVHGNLRWRGPNAPDISADARVDGQIIEQPMPELDDEDDAGGALWFTASVIVAIVILYLLFPRQARETAAAIREQPWLSLGVGLGLLALTPFAIALLLITGIGALLGIAVLGSYAVLMLLGALAGLFAASDIGLRVLAKRAEPSLSRRLLAIVVAVLAVSLLSQIPLIGFLLVAALWLIGLGGLGVEALRSYRQARAV